MVRPMAETTDSQARDYRLIGGAGELARSRGLVSASWYKSTIPRAAMKELMRRSDREAIRDTLIWYALILSAGALAFFSIGTVWAVPAFLLYGTLYAGPADSRWHETGHGTAFRTVWINDLVYQVASFQCMRRPTVWRWSHARHHTDTLVTGRDLEVQAQLPIRPLALLADFIGLKLAPEEFLKALGNAAGHISEEEKSFIPPAEWPRVVRQAQAWIAIYACLAALCFYLGSVAASAFYRSAVDLRRLALQFLRPAAACLPAGERSGSPPELPHSDDDSPGAVPLLEHELPCGTSHVPHRPLPRFAAPA